MFAQIMTSLTIWLLFFIADCIKESAVNEETKFIPEVLITGMPFFFVYMSVSFFIPIFTTKVFKYPKTQAEDETDESIEKSIDSKIETTGCVIPVLSLGKEMKEKGMHRNYWEGGLFGEGGFRGVKPFIKRGTHLTGVFLATLNKMYIVRSIHEMIACDDVLDENGFSISDETEDTELLDVSRYRRFHCYAKLEILNNAIDTKSPIAAFYHHTQKKFFLCYGTKNKKELLEIKLTETRNLLDTFLFNVELDSDDNAKDIAEVSLDSSEYLSVLMLPLCYGNDEDDVLYYAIADDHKEYCGDANWKIPEILLESTIFSDSTVQEVLESISI